MAEKKNITVFGATGKIGSTLIKLLSQAQVPTIAVTRTISKANLMPFIEWVEADMANKEGLFKTMSDSKAVFLLSGQSENFVEEQNNVIAAAKEQGVSSMVKLSSGAADKDSILHIPRVHGKVEAFLMASGISWTMLRPNGIMQNWLGETAKTVREERKIYEATGDGKRAHIDLRDIAEVAFKALTVPEKYAGNAYLLTGDEALNYEQVAATISRAIGETVKYVQITSEEAKKQMEQSGMPRWAVQTFIAYDEAQRHGKTAMVSNAVNDILLRPARTVEAFVREYADKFK